MRVMDSRNRHKATYLSAVLVHEFTDFTDALFEDTVRRGIRDHERGQLVLVLQRLYETHQT